MRSVDGIAEINPIRYRSYYYDNETGLYYLKSRYYDPEVGRFINMDAIEELRPNVVNGLNLYAYCLNNPVMFSDPSGKWLISALLIGLVVGLGVAGAAPRTLEDIGRGARNIASDVWNFVWHDSVVPVWREWFWSWDSLEGMSYSFHNSNNKWLMLLAHGLDILQVIGNIFGWW